MLNSKSVFFSFLIFFFISLPTLSVSVDEITIFCSDKGKPKCSNGRKARCSAGYQPRCIKGEPQLKPDCCKKVFDISNNDPDFLKCDSKKLKCKKKGANPGTITEASPICENGIIKCPIGAPSCSNNANLGKPSCLTIGTTTFPGCQSSEGFYAEEATCNTAN